MRSVLVFFAILALVPSFLFAADAAPTSKPNIVFLLIDDLGYTDCGFNGGRDIKTPHIDRLAASGAVLESHYVQPVCSPTRAAFMTGRYATRTGVYTIVRPHAKWGLKLEERTLANALKETGYETAITGKWHLGEFEPEYLPTRRGFDHQYGHYFGALDYFTKMRGNDYDWHRDDRPLKEEGYTTELVAQEACRLIANKDRSKPLFLYVPFNGVHAPMQVPERYLQPYGDLKGPRRQLAGMLAAVDEAIGRIVESLDKAGLRDNTLIVFSADNGGPPPGTNTPLKGFKGSLNEGGVRGCAFATWPGKIPAGQRIKEPLHVIDWYPTLIRLAGGQLEQKLPIDGKDVWPLLTQNAKSPHDAILCVQNPNAAAVRMGDWKLVSHAAPLAAGTKKKAQAKKKPDTEAEVELFNLATDIGETTDLSAQEPQRIAAMKARLAEFLKNAVPSGAVGPDAAE